MSLGRRGLRRWALAVAATALFVGGPGASPAFAVFCNSDVQGSDDQPGQKDLSEFCNLGTCNVSDRSMAFNFDDLAWSGNNTGDGCFLFDTNGDGLVNYSVCATLSGQTVLSGPRCFQCNNSRPDRCQNNAPQVPCSSTCALNTTISDPFAGDPAHTANKCNGTNCRLVDARVTCCLTNGDTGGGGALIDVCSYPSGNPGSDPSDCVVSRQCNNNNDCGDNNPCTVDTCNQDHVCQHVAGNAGALCRTAAGVCDAAEFCDGVNTTCPPDGFTTGGVCRPAAGVCDVAETCSGSSASCPPDGAANAGTLCRAASGPCDVAEFCDGTNSTCPTDGSQPNGTPCTDNNACTNGDTCQGGVCTAGPALNCNDNNVCTDDSCNPASGCVHVNNEDPCSDGNACTTNDTCSNGGCVGGPPLNCNDNNVCTTDGCNPQSGCTTTNNNGAPCDDANACTVGDTCQGGTCQGSPANCDDSNACTADSCVSPTGCVHTPIQGCTCTTDADCTDTDQCTTNERCVSNQCVSDPVVCDDTNPCTDDSCNPSTGCVFVNNNDPCNDNNACTTGDTCSGGSCHGGPPLDCVDNNPCTDDNCNPNSGCENPNNSDPCDDGNACTNGDVCSGGQCTPGTPVVCNDGNPCTDDDCNPSTGCVTTNNTDPCDDGDGCTVGDACSGGQCVSGAPKTCSDQNPCTDDTCVSPSGDCQFVNNASPCSDGDNCTENDVCTNGSCVPGAPKDCNDHLGCTLDSCHSPDGECLHSPNGAFPAPCCEVDTDCIDSDFCTENERCVNHQCVSDPVNCDDQNPCTVDHCDNAGGGFLCIHDNCLDLQAQCPPSCVAPARCGDGILNQPMETCDPPDPTLIPGTDQVRCRPDCTYCGDGHPDVGETCDDGNMVSGCDPQHPRTPLDSCTNSCKLPICDDPSKINFNEFVDRIDVHGRLVSPGSVDFSSEMFVLQLVDSKKAVVFRASLHGGDLVGTPGGKVFRYKNKAAKATGGAYSVKIKRVAGTYRTTATAYGNLYNAGGDMLTQFFSGSDSWIVQGVWQHTVKGWRFVQ